MEITKREIIASIAIIAIMLIIGIGISSKISDAQNDKNAEYQKAMQIEDAEIFKYGMDTNIGNAFVYGRLEAVDTVTYSEISGEYLYVKKVEERYERHTRTVKDDDGNTHTKTYYTWDVKSSDSIHTEEIMFCGIVFPYNKITLPSANYIDTLNGQRVWSWESGEYVKVRFKYYGVSTEHIGTIYTRLGNGTISDNSRFFENCNTQEALEKSVSNIGVIIFWILWIMFIAACVYGFYYLDNKWLE